MDSFDDDMFALSDEELPIPTSACNPIEEYLMKQLSSVQTRIEKTTSDIKEIQDTTKRILKSLYSEAQYGENVTSDSDSDLYTIDGTPVVKKKKHNDHKPERILVIKNKWKRILSDQWIIGIVLENSSNETLNNIQCYMTIDGVEEIGGLSMFWCLMDGPFWYRTNKIQSHKEVVATIVFDLPKFDKDSFCDAYGTIAYEINEKQYQTPVPEIRLCVEETVDNSCGIKFSTDFNYSILALKSVSIERIVGVKIEGNLERGERLLGFLEKNYFLEICADVYVANATGSLMHCLIEILPIVNGEARLKIFSRSAYQMNIILRLLRDQFPDISLPDNDNSIYAAMVLVEELKLHLKDASIAERQMARIRTDLLIS